MQKIVDKLYKNFKPPKNFVQIKNYLNKHLEISDENCLKTICQFIIFKPIIDFTIHPEVIKNNQHLKIYNNLNIQIPELKSFYSKNKNIFNSLDKNEKPKFLINLYNKILVSFCNKTADKDGIVFTPKQITNFMINFTNKLYNDHFNKSIYDKGIKIIDPFVGTGNYIESFIDLADKTIQSEIFAQEINPIASLLASLNIENQFYLKYNKYIPFYNIKLCDTFKQFEYENQENPLFNNNIYNNKFDIIIGNPPYRAQQNRTNDNNYNDKHAYLDKSIQNTYVYNSIATRKQCVYDSYAKSIKLASLSLNQNGIIALITNNSFIDSISFDGFRYCINNDFNYIYIVNLGGNLRRKEGSKVFNVFNIMVGVSINFFIKKKNSNDHKIFYSRFDDSLKPQITLNNLNNNIKFNQIIPFNQKHIRKDLKTITTQNWFHSNEKDLFNSFISLGNKIVKKVNENDLHKVKDQAIFKNYLLGFATACDKWILNFNYKKLKKNIKKLINNYNYQLDKYKKHKNINKLNYDPTYIKWSRKLLDKIIKYKKLKSFDKSKVTIDSYRPFVKKYLYYSDDIIEKNYKLDLFFINVTEIGSNGFFSLASKKHPESHFVEKCKSFHFYQPTICFSGLAGNNFYSNAVNSFFALLFADKTQGVAYYNQKRENITDWALIHFQTKYNNKYITKKKIFFYVYSILNHPVYKSRFKNDLYRSIPRIPLLKEFNLYYKIGKQLMKMHIYYESYNKQYNKYIINKNNFYVKKMKMIKNEKSFDIIYNDYIQIIDIPNKVLDYKIGEHSAVKWLLLYYQIKKDKDSGLIENPNNPKKPKYIFNLVLKVIQISLDTQKLINKLPKNLNFL